MSDWLVVFNAALLLTCTAIYLGTGVSLALFSLPSAKDMTPDNYYDQVVPQVARATTFFTVMTNVMLVSAALMLWSEWGTWYLAVPIAEFVLIGLATAITVRGIFPLNQRLKAGITDPVELREVLDRWVPLSWFRTSAWAAEFVVMATWFVGQAR